MLAPRRNNELDNFISQQTALPRMLSPRKMVFPAQHHQPQRTVSPNRIANTRKPMISPSPARPAQPKGKIVGRGQQCCSNENHRGRKAEYLIHIEDEDMYYCGVCATQAASQGFTVNRITVKKQKTVPHCPSYASNPRYQQLTALMRDIVRLEAEYKNKSPRALQEHYQQQEGLLVDFYDSLMGKVAEIRDQHLQQFRQQQAMSIAAGEMHFSNLQLHMQDLNQAWEDIEETFQDVLEKIDPESFQDGMRTYRNTLNVFRHKLEEFEETIQPTSFDQNQLTARLRQAEEYFSTFWRQEPSQQRPSEKPSRVSAAVPVKSNQTNLKNVHQGLPKSHQPSEAPTAFRNLFPDQSQQIQLDASPQFKAF